MRTEWTEEQSAVVKEHYNNKPIAEIAALLNRPASSVYQKARKLGLRKYEKKPIATAPAGDTHQGDGEPVAVPA